MCNAAYRNRGSDDMTAVDESRDAGTPGDNRRLTRSVSERQFEVVSPEKTFEAVTNSDRSLLIDIRTNAEWCLVGTPDVENVMFFEWRDLTGALVPTFTEELHYWVRSDIALHLLSRSGQVRAQEAAAAALRAGFDSVFIVEGGFEGPLESHGHRGDRGWRAEGLPWLQW